MSQEILNVLVCKKMSVRIFVGKKESSVKKIVGKKFVIFADIFLPIRYKVSI